jgi:hypothetical protein
VGGFLLERLADSVKTPDFLIEAARRNGALLKYVDEKLRTPELCYQAIKNNGAALEFTPAPLRTEALCAAALETNPFALEFFPAALKLAPSFTARVHAAVEKDGRVVRFVPATLLTQELCMQAVSSHADAIEYIPKHFRTAELWKAAIIKSGYWLKKAPPSLLNAANGYELCLRAVQSHGQALQDVPARYQTKEIFFAAVRQDGKALKYVDVSRLTSEEYTELCRVALYRESPSA